MNRFAETAEWRRFSTVERDPDNRHIMDLNPAFPFLARSWELSIDDYLEPNWHDYAEIALIEEGAGLCLIGNVLSALEPGMLIPVAPGRPHTFWSGPGSRIRFRAVYFDPALVAPPGSGPLHHEYLAPFAGGGPERPLSASGIAGRRAAAALRSICAVEGCPAGTEDRLSALADLQAVLTDLRRLEEGRIPDRRERIALERWGALKTLVNAAGNEWLSVDDAAAAIGMSRWGFCRYFKAETGLTWTEWLRHRAVDRAKDLLAATDASISGIAMDAGFANLSWFNRSFKEIAGCTPREYRNRTRRPTERDS